MQCRFRDQLEAAGATPGRTRRVDQSGGADPRHPAPPRRGLARRVGCRLRAHEPAVPLPEHEKGGHAALVRVVRLQRSERAGRAGGAPDHRRGCGARVVERQRGREGRMGRILVPEQRLDARVGQPDPGDRLHLLQRLLARGRHVAGPRRPVARHVDEHDLGHGHLQAAGAHQGLCQPRVLGPRQRRCLAAAHHQHGHSGHPAAADHRGRIRGRHLAPRRVWRPPVRPGVVQPALQAVRLGQHDAGSDHAAGLDDLPGHGVRALRPGRGGVHRRRGCGAILLHP